MATIGQQLNSPEPGWKRYEDTHPAIKYEGLGWTSSATETVTTSSDGKISFKFKGTKLRILGLSNNVRSSHKIVIDDNSIVSVYSNYRSTAQEKTLIYEITGLNDTIHMVEITKVDDNMYFGIDAIDIDDTGRLYHPDEVENISDLDIGSRIRCHYTASSNTVGTFSGLGAETGDFIPSASTPTPNGDFYFICVDRDHLDRWVLIADRNIQTGIAWTTLNNNGFVFGREINFDGVSGYRFKIRIPTGGISSSDKDNEWDRYVVNSTLNGKIVPGDKSVWNWGVYSWTSTASGSNRVIRGSGSVAGYTSASPTYARYGFRPVLIVEKVNYLVKNLINDGGQYREFDYNNLTWTSLGSAASETLFRTKGYDGLRFVLGSLDTRYFVMNDQGTLGGGKLIKGTVDKTRLNINRIGVS